MLILGIESSCDDTGVGVVEDGRWMRGNACLSSAEIHARFGGVVPELASREHVMAILPAIEAALSQAGACLADCDAIAVTQGPGLLGALLVGVTAAKALALALHRPLIGVHHLEAHLYANALEAPIQYPALALLASGGHTAMYRWEGDGRLVLLGDTQDDAAGEALDKGARILGLGYPGGPAIERLALTVDETPFKLPVARLRRPQRPYDVSFSGLKTALAALYRQHPDQSAALARALEEAVVAALTEKAVQALVEERLHRIYLAGGVSANRRLRTRLTERAAELGRRVYAPEPVLATDNGAMVATAGYYHWRLGHRMAMHEGPKTPYALGE